MDAGPVISHFRSQMLRGRLRVSGKVHRGVGAPRLAFVAEPGPAAEEDDESSSGVPVRQTGLCRLPFSHRRQSSHMTEAKAPAVVVDTTEFQPDLLLSKAHGCKRGCGR